MMIERNISASVGATSKKERNREMPKVQRRIIKNLHDFFKGCDY
jgi:hypothetical protein